MQTRVVLSTGRPARSYDPPAEARLMVSVDLGHAFRAVPLDEQRRMIERGLTDALEITLAKLDEEPATPVEPVEPAGAVA